MDNDDINRLRELVYLGYYKSAIELSNDSTVGDEQEKEELKSIIAKSKYAMKDASKQELQAYRKSENPSLSSIGYYSQCLETKSESERKMAMEGLKANCKNHNPTSMYLTAAALVNLENLSAALDYTMKEPIELLVLKIQIILMMDRLDIAGMMFHEMSLSNDDSSLCHYAGVLVNMAIGNYQEAYLSCGDIQNQLCHRGDPESFTSSIVLNAKAGANIARKEWQDAMDDLKRSYDKNPKDVNTLVNLVCSCRNLKMDAEADSYFQQLTDVCPDHPFVTKSNLIDQVFMSFEKPLL